MSQTSCCPHDSWGELNNPDYVAKGTTEKVEDLDIYKVSLNFATPTLNKSPIHPQISNALCIHHPIYQMLV